MFGIFWQTALQSYNRYSAGNKILCNVYNWKPKVFYNYFEITFFTILDTNCKKVRLFRATTKNMIQVWNGVLSFGRLIVFNTCWNACKTLAFCRESNIGALLWQALSQATKRGRKNASLSPIFVVVGQFFAWMHSFGALSAVRLTPTHISLSYVFTVIQLQYVVPYITAKSYIATKGGLEKQNKAFL